MTASDHPMAKANITVTPTLFFHGDGADAADFYISLFPSSRILSTAPSPYGTAPLTHLLSLNAGALTVLLLNVPLSAHPPCNDNASTTSTTATDDAAPPSPPWRFNESFSFTVLCDTQAEIDYYWDTIVGGGGKGKDCCWCEDRWGVSWQIVPRLLVECNEAGGERGERARGVMMRWGKADVGELEAAVGATEG